jgi:ABC-type tungstate transport system permease subunit
LLASTSGISAFVHDPTTGDLVVLVTGLSTDADGVLEITDALLEADTSYRVVIRVTGTGAEGMDTYTAV